MFGYFHFLWADATIKVAKIDTAAKTITTERPYSYGGNGMSAEQGIQYSAFMTVGKSPIGQADWSFSKITFTTSW